MVLKRFVNGADGEPFFQKRAPDKRPDWIETVTLSFPSGRTAEEIVVRDAAQLAWMVNLGCIDLNPHPVRADDLDHPDELRVDLDPVPGVAWPQILPGRPGRQGRAGRFRPHRLAEDVRARAASTSTPGSSRAGRSPRSAAPPSRWPGRSSGGRPTWPPRKWWKEERHGVFVDYNQNAKDRTVASAYSVRPTPDARVSTPLTWPEVPDCDPAAFTIGTVPERFAELGDPWAGIDDAAGSLEPLLALAAEHEAAGLGDAPWPPHYDKQAGEPPRVQPSKRRTRGRRPVAPPPGKTERPDRAPPVAPCR